MTPQEALEIKFMNQDLRRRLTIREYMQELLTRLFDEGEGFSGKRPFGNSGWEYDILVPLIRAKAVKGKVFDGYPEEYDEAAYKKLLADMIAAL